MVRTNKPDTLSRTLRMQADVELKAKSDEAVDLASRRDNNDNNVPIFDIRHPTYLGEWNKSIPYIHEDIAIDDMDEPHLKRKHAILSIHPDITNLYSIEWKTKYITILLVSIQLFISYSFGNSSGWLHNTHWSWIIVTSYFLGGTFTGMFGVLIHEAAHNLAFKSNLPNRILGLIANIGILFPIASSFRRYHLEHHTFQGVHGKDPDLPLDIEWKVVKGNRILKFLWVFCFPIFYVLRGAVMMKIPQKWEVINWVWTILCDYAIYQYCGSRGFIYMFLSLWFGYGFHPGAAHFIQEHYTFHDGQETMSYYGSGNWLFMNIGYHNEHHDFTKIPWTKLPELHRIAPEFYSSLAYHTSWIKVILDFIWLDYLGPQSRVGRTFDDHKAGRATIAFARKLKRD